MHQLHPQRPTAVWRGNCQKNAAPVFQTGGGCLAAGVRVAADQCNRRGFGPYYGRDI